MLVPRIHVAVVPHAALEDVLLQAEGRVPTQHLHPGVHRHVEDALVVVVLPDELPLLILGPGEGTFFRIPTIADCDGSYLIL